MFDALPPPLFLERRKHAWGRARITEAARRPRAEHFATAEPGGAPWRQNVSPERVAAAAAAAAAAPHEVGDTADIDCRSRKQSERGMSSERDTSFTARVRS